MTYFKNISELSELRKLYYQLAMKYHPDKGGDLAVMQAINNEYESYSKRLIDGNIDFSSERKVYEAEVSQELQTKINEVIHLENVTIEVIGDWLWITGNTFPHKDELKAMSFRFSRNKLAWYFHAQNYRKIGNKNFTLDGIRELWGSVEIEKKSKQSLALN